MTMATIRKFTSCTAFATDNEVRDFVNRVTGSGSNNWGHHARIVTAAWLLLNNDESEATSRFLAVAMENETNQHRLLHGTYNETVSLFWVAIICKLLLSLEERPLYSMVNRVVEKFADKPLLHLDYYSAECISSWRARTAWVEPNIKPILCNSKPISNKPA